MRALSGRQAVTCEAAASKRCRCRCGGTLHGAGRVATPDEARLLPDDDAHRAGQPSSPWPEYVQLALPFPGKEPPP